MSKLNYYDPLTTIDDKEQNTLGKMQNAFNSALGSSNSSQDTMISSYMSANDSRKACYSQCPWGWSNDWKNWEKDIKKNSEDTSATPEEALKDVRSSCRAGCDLKWPGIIQNIGGTQGVDGGQAVGKYTGSDGEEHDIAQCTDLSKFAPKTKVGGLCDANEECESDVCVNWGGKCARSGETLTGKDGRCGLSMVRIDGSNYAWGNTWNSMCKKDIQQYGLKKWPNYTQYFKYQGVWVKLSSGWGFPSAPKINNQRLENGQYIQDEATAFKAAEAYGDYCKGFYQQDGATNFILQSAGGENPKQSWSEFLGEMGGLNYTRVSEGFTESEDENKSLANKPGMVVAAGKFRKSGIGALKANSKDYNKPTFPIAHTKAAMKKTCPKGWRSIRDGESCGIFNDDMRTRGGSGWNGSSFGCNLPNTNSRYSLDCEDVANENFTCWVPSSATVPKGKAACKPIKGRDIGDCISSGGRARKTRCPVAAKMVIWIGRPSASYFATKSNIISVMQQIATEFPDVRLTDQKEMNDIIAKNIANCAYGWYRTDVRGGTTWRSGTGPFEKLPLTNGYPSNTSSSGGCGSGKQKMIGPSRGKGGIYITVSATQEFVKAKLYGLGFTSRIVMSHQQMIAPVPPQKKQVWSLGSKGNSSVYVAPKPINAEGPDWRKVGGQLKQLSTGQKEVYGVNIYDTIYARAKDPGKRNAAGGTEWRQIGGRLSNISASNKDYVFGVNKHKHIYQCKKPCTGAWQRINGELSQISGGQNYVYGIGNNDTPVRKKLDSDGARNAGWVSLPGSLKWINATNKDYIYGTNRAGRIYTCRKPCSGSWKQLPGGLDKIEADATKVYGVNSGSKIYSKPMDGMDAQGNWKYWSSGGGSTNVSPEPFVGGVKEGYSPLENDMIYQCKVAGTQGGESVPGVNPTGNFLVENRKKEKASFAKLQSMQIQVKKSINQMQGENLQVNDLYKTKNTDLLKQLASYEQASHELLKSGANLDTLGAQQSDSLLRKNSIDMSYYLWLTLAISILGIAITKIK
jgi:hypothetical protein